MTWQLGSVLVLTFALAIGFGWYERSRPPARVLALVAALAALAAIGRVAFAAFPNVKPTTDIVLFAGYSLGGPAGFACGALAALVSNVFLGQGPWTPWQMAAWGIVGLGGAVFGRLMRGREPGRLALALACGLAGVVFGALMDLYQWSLAAEHTLASYLTISGTSLGFNIAHVAGNVFFAMLIGPAFIRALTRYRRRFEVRWAPAARAAAITGVLVLLLAVPAAAEPPADVAPAIARAVHYLRFSQNPDGGFGAARKQSSTTLHTGWTALGLGSAGRNPRDLDQRSNSAMDFIAAHAGAMTDVGEIERTLLVLRAAGMKPELNGRNLLARLVRAQRKDGSFGTVNHTAFGILALRASGRTTRSKEVRAAAHFLLRAQNRDGGYGFSRRSASDIDDTGAALEALAASGHSGSPVARRAVGFLRRAQRPDGGFAQMPAGESNAQSTAWAVQGLVAVGRNPRNFRRTRTPIEYLKSLQAGDGSVRYSRTSTQTPVWVTAQALAALEGKPFPLKPAPRHLAHATTATATTPAAPSAPKAPVEKAKAAAKPKKRAPAVKKSSTSTPRLGASESEIEVTPAASTTTVPADTAPASKSDDKPSRWPLYFMAGLGIAALVGLRFAWRRG
jgi:energy-coupling factor transport system substrate-specific component